MKLTPAMACSAVLGQNPPGARLDRRGRIRERRLEESLRLVGERAVLAGEAPESVRRPSSHKGIAILRAATKEAGEAGCVSRGDPETVDALTDVEPRPVVLDMREGARQLRYLLGRKARSIG